MKYMNARYNYIREHVLTRDVDFHSVCIDYLLINTLTRILNVSNLGQISRTPSLHLLYLSSFRGNVKLIVHPIFDTIDSERAN